MKFAEAAMESLKRRDNHRFTTFRHNGVGHVKFYPCVPPRVPVRACVEVYFCPLAAQYRNLGSIHIWDLYDALNDQFDPALLFGLPNDGWEIVEDNPC